MDVLSLTDLYDLQLVVYIQVAFSALLIYDTLLNINQELEHIWASRWSIIKCLYLWTRYSTFLDTAFLIAKHFDLALAPSCSRITNFDTIFAGLGIGFAEGILMVRTYALYNRSRKLLFFFIFMWTCIIGVNVWPVVKWSDHPDDTSIPPPLPACNPESSNDIILVSYGTLLFSETIIVLLTLWKGFYTFRNGLYVRQSQLITTFYRDGLFWYLAMQAVFIVNVVFQTTARPSIKSIADTPMRILHSVLACRLVVHVRCVAAKDQEQTFGSLGGTYPSTAI
ncbi:hypothetical protein FB45DRAFT_918423 [Roridomyces roridus]|uniref:DUF6533 domain-containing protein n=1 Tax=Roridomyces roridus TaxID=1738132 RepID=A0AAD7BR16_9AGAR|nr:hypothetical protein FB45DRAFT_918423 [Roridomyces roridus]